jgi:hypothetical protein
MAALYIPGVQLLQSKSVAALNDPGRQPEHCVSIFDPAADDEPALHVWHVVSDNCRIAVLNFPPAQRIHSVRSAEEYDPAGQVVAKTNQKMLSDKGEYFSTMSEPKVIDVLLELANTDSKPVLSIASAVPLCIPEPISAAPRSFPDPP